MSGKILRALPIRNNGLISAENSILEIELPILTHSYPRDWHALIELPMRLRQRAFKAWSCPNELGYPKRLLVYLCKNTAIGWLIYSLPKAMPSAQVELIFTAASHRREGVATALFSTFMELMSSQKIRHLNLLYLCDGLDNCIAVEALLQRFKWSKPYLRWSHGYFDIPQFAPPWFLLPLKLSEHYHLFPITAWSPSRWQMALTSLRFPSHLHPYLTTTPPEPQTSYAIRYRDNVVGWMSTCLSDPTLLRYAAFWLAPQHRKPGIAMTLLKTAIVSQQNSSIRWATLEVDWPNSEQHWRRLYMRSLVPYAEHVEWLGYSGWSGYS